MDQPPTRAEFNELKEEVRQLKEQRTEEIKAVRVEVASEDVLNQLKALGQGQQELKQEFHTVYDTLYDTLQDHYKEHETHFKKIEDAMVTKQDLETLAKTLKEDFKELLIQYLRPGGNGHSKES